VSKKSESGEFVMCSSAANAKYSLFYSKETLRSTHIGLLG